MSRAIKDQGLRQERRLEIHPDVEELADYDDGILAPDRQAEIRRHLALCRACTSTFLELIEPLPWEEEASPKPKPAPSKIVPLPALATTAWWRNARALAACMALVALISLIVNAYLAQRTTDGPQPSTNLFVADLYPLGDTVRGDDSGKSVVVPADPTQNKILFLAFIDSGDFSAYHARILDTRNGNRVLWKSQSMASVTDGVQLQLPGSFLAPGDYRVQLLGRTADGPKILAEYLFSISP